MSSAFRNLAPRIMRDLLAEPAFGFSRDDAAAIVGNLAHETLGFTKMQEMKPTVKGSRGGYGWPQWTGSRRVAFEHWCAGKGVSPDSYEGNYSFLYRELAMGYAKAVSAVKAAATLDGKVKAFEKAYEGAKVKAYASRLKWARQAIDAFAATTPAGDPAKPAPAPAQAAAGSKPVSDSWFMKLLTKVGLLRKPAAPAVAPADPAARSTLVTRVQKQLQALGYAEVGLADGLAGPKLRDAILAFCADQMPALASTGEITDDFLAALPKAKMRAVSPARAHATAKDLRAAGNVPAKVLRDMGFLGGLGGLFGAGGAINASGVLDSLKSTSDNVSETFATLTSILTSIVGVVQWCVLHWWLFALVGGVYAVFRVVTAVMNLVVLFRQGVLARPAA